VFYWFDGLLVYWFIGLLVCWFTGLQMSWQYIQTLYITKTKKLKRKFVNMLFSPILMHQCRDAKFTEPLIVSGLGDSLGFLLLHRCDKPGKPY
jgi:hypothetical protein